MLQDQVESATPSRKFLDSAAQECSAGLLKLYRRERFPGIYGEDIVATPQKTQGRFEFVRSFRPHKEYVQVWE
jgi:hypothetical protein